MSGAHKQTKFRSAPAKNVPNNSTLLGITHAFISWFLLVLGRVPGLVSLFFWLSVPSSFLDSFWFRVGFRELSP